jgi:MHS family proline/betaine transporter-like MFS transporter
VALLAEASPDHSRGFHMSWYVAGQALGFVLAASITMAITLVLTPAEIEAGGWRLPFLFGLLIVPVALYIRVHVEEPKIFLRTRSESKCVGSPDAIWRERRPILVGLGVSALYVFSGYVIFVYMPTFAARELGLSFTGALLATIVANCLALVCAPFAAAWSDRIGRRPVLQLATIGFLLLTYPGYAIITAWPTFASLAFVQCCLGVVIAMYFGPCISVLAELFPTSIRSTSVALTINFMTIFGGFAPAFATWLISATADPRAPALIVIGASLLSGLTLFWLKDNHRHPLR